MAKRKQLSTKDLPPKSKGRFNFDLDAEDFEDFKCGYVPPNTALETQKCMKLFSCDKRLHCMSIRNVNIKQHIKNSLRMEMPFYSR